MWKVCWFVFLPPSPLKQVTYVLFINFFLLKFSQIKILSSKKILSIDLVSVTGAWTLVWGLMAGLQGFASHKGSILLYLGAGCVYNMTQGPILHKRCTVVNWSMLTNKEQE